MTRTWRMFAGLQDRVVEDREFLHFGDEWYVRAYGDEPARVELTEDPDGRYWGWIDFDDGRDSTPTMIQPHWGMFEMQFPYGPKASVDRGRGEIVRMSCRPVEDDRAKH